jgi:hypothetical protein
MLVAMIPIEERGIVMAMGYTYRLGPAAKAGRLTSSH